MAAVRYSYTKLKDFCIDAFSRFGFSQQESSIITDVILLADLYGTKSHGVQRLVRYHKGIEKGLIKVEAKPEIVFETPVSAVVDGHDGMGQLIAFMAMELAIKKAKMNGIAVVTVRNSNHFGIAGYYAKMASDNGLIGIAMTNSEAIMVPTYCRMAMLGSNPVAIAMPADPYPFYFDASTSVITRGKLEVYNKQGKRIPKGLAVNAEGKCSTDAAEVLNNIISKKGGGILPLGGEDELTGSHKGYGYGMFCEIFSSILSMGMTSNHTHTAGKGGTCHGFIAIDPQIFGDPKQLARNFSNFLQELREAPKAAGAKQIFTHGEKEIISYNNRKKYGVYVDKSTVREMYDLANFLGMDIDDYFRQVHLDCVQISSYA